MNIKQLLTATILLLPSGAYGQSEFDEAKFLAEQGDAEAQLNLGIRYANGEGVPEDDAEAVKLYRLAAKQGDAEAQNNLGIMYANGDGVPQNRGQTTFKRLGLPELRLLKKTVVCPRLHRLHCGNAGSFTGIAVEARCYLKKKKGMT